MIVNDTVSVYSDKPTCQKKNEANRTFFSEEPVDTTNKYLILKKGYFTVTEEECNNSIKLVREYHLENHPSIKL